MTPRKRAAKRLALASSLLVIAACVPPYTPPTSNMPHAVVKFRRRYGAVFGTTLTETLSINDKPAFASEASAWDAHVPATSGVLVHPGSVTIGAEASFWHLSREPGYPMGYCGGWRAPVSCYSTSRSVPITDAVCSRSLDLEMRAGEVYLLELDFVDATTCRLVCYRQESRGSGRVRMFPCES